MSEQMNMAEAQASGLGGRGLVLSAKGDKAVQLDEVQDRRPLVPAGVWVLLILCHELLLKVAAGGVRIASEL